MNQFKRWITAEPVNNRSLLRSIPLKLLTGTLWLYIGYTFFSGIGTVFASATPYGFKTKQIGNNIIHYEKIFENDLKTYFNNFTQARIKNDILWNQGEVDILSESPLIHLYLCSSKSKAFQLSSVVTPAITLFGNKIVLSMEYVDELNWDITSVLNHEISHVNVAVRYGWIQNYFNRPIWLDEGIASIQSNFWQHTPENFRKLLEKNSYVTSISKLNSLVEWNSGFLLGRDNYIKQYCYSKLVATNVIKNNTFYNLKLLLRGDISTHTLLVSNIHEYEKKTLYSSEIKPFNINLQYPDAAFKTKFFWTMQLI